ncbi:MAG: hypothetical protein GWN87_27210 [Desulfuromonadales bacterium]|nr:hypothetical protein [Desulfuromonadales bacterium]NIS43414.1 hypothetical protein [Desulfuromonadales bacterium]
MKNKKNIPDPRLFSKPAGGKQQKSLTIPRRFILIKARSFALAVPGKPDNILISLNE